MEIRIGRSAWPARADQVLFRRDISHPGPVSGSAFSDREQGMKVEEVMTHDVAVANPRETIQQAARLMCELDIGALPVADDERLVGMITDRDIAIRAVAEGLGPRAKVADVMTTDVKYCFCDQELAEVSDNM